MVREHGQASFQIALARDVRTAGVFVTEGKWAGTRGILRQNVLVFAHQLAEIVPFCSESDYARELLAQAGVRADTTSRTTHSARSDTLIALVTGYMRSVGLAGNAALRSSGVRPRSVLRWRCRGHP